MTSTSFLSTLRQLSICIWGSDACHMWRVFSWQVFDNVLNLMSYMEQSPPWETNSRSTRQEIPRLCGTQDFSLLFTRDRHFFILSQPNPIHTLWPYLCKFILLLSSTYIFISKVVSFLQVSRLTCAFHIFPCVLNIPPIWSSSISSP